MICAHLLAHIYFSLLYNIQTLQIKERKKKKHNVTKNPNIRNKVLEKAHHNKFTLNKKKNIINDHFKSCLLSSLALDALCECPYYRHH